MTDSCPGAGTIGHVAHGKSSTVKAISGVQTVRFKNELERNITIKLGYANAKVSLAFCSWGRPRTDPWAFLRVELKLSFSYTNARIPNVPRRPVINRTRASRRRTRNASGRDVMAG